jgi:hypothetical protein
VGSEPPSGVTKSAADGLVGAYSSFDGPAKSLASGHDGAMIPA